MPVIASAEDVCPSRRRANSNGANFWLTTYIGANRYTSGAETSPEPGTIYPMAFLVEQDAGAIVGAHYHQADQFQVVVGGAGRLGHHDIAAPAVHFAGAWSPLRPAIGRRGRIAIFHAAQRLGSGRALYGVPRQPRNAACHATLASRGDG